MLCVHAYYTVVHFAVATDNNHLALRMCALFLMETVDSVLSHRIVYGMVEWRACLLCEAMCPRSPKKKRERISIWLGCEPIFVGHKLNRF